MSTREKRVKRRRQRVRDDILDVARGLIIESGVGSVTLSAIADELELTKQALYYYFDSKDDLIFEIVHEVMGAEVAAIEASVADATTGPDAVEAIIRTVTGHYHDRFDEFRLAYLAGQVGTATTTRPEHLERIRPFNEAAYGRAERLIRADQEAGRVDSSVNARRAAFLAHASALGLLTYLGMIEAGGDGPLIHSVDDLVDDLVASHRARLAG